jgi:acyl carrier protein
MADIVNELRELIVKAAPDPGQAEQVRNCGEDELLDAIIPFSSVILLGVVVAVEDRYAIRVTRDSLTNMSVDGTTLRKVALMIERLQTQPKSM